MSQCFRSEGTSISSSLSRVQALVSRGSKDGGRRPNILQSKKIRTILPIHKTDRRSTTAIILFLRFRLDEPFLQEVGTSTGQLSLPGVGATKMDQQRKSDPAFVRGV